MDLRRAIGEAIVAHFRRFDTEATSVETANTQATEQMEEEDQEEGQPQQPPCLYKIEDAFSTEDLYWIEKVRGSRFEESLKVGILYRPQIVDQLAEKVEGVLNARVAKGIMVKGPGGIGKSHSLVNLVRKLVYDSNNKYLVTFIPDCDGWDNVYGLLEAICASFGICSDEIFSKIKGNDTLDALVLDTFLKDIYDILKSMNKQWVFIFDQINKLFCKGTNREAKDASGLTFPYKVIQSVMKPGRITSIISASANNEMAYKERHDGFSEFIHESRMTEVEIITAFSLPRGQEGGTALDQAKNIVTLTGGVPLYVREYLKSDTVGIYEDTLSEPVGHSLIELEKRGVMSWQLVKEAAFACLLKIPTASPVYDMKFLTQKSVNGNYEYQALVPQVKTVLRTVLWNDLMAYVSKEEGQLLAICGKPTTLNSARGQHFEFIVIQRCLRDGVQATIDNVTINLGADTAHGFAGRALPSLHAARVSDGIYFPYHSKFPAIDLVIKQGPFVFGIQIHVNPHENVIAMFEGMCRAANWFETFEKIYLVYLSPEEQVKNLVANLVDPADHQARYGTMRSSSDKGNCSIRRIALSRDAVQCLDNLQWPAGCSINSQ